MEPGRKENHENSLIHFDCYGGGDEHRIIRQAIDIGYRFFDTASLYETERILGTAIRESGLPREDLIMVGKYKVITLCGSTRFKNAFMEAQKRLTLEGNIVISVGLFGHSGDDEVWTEGTKAMLDDMHKRKIDMADEIFVINVGGYIGSSTRSEIEYARKTGKKIRYLEED